MIRSKTRDKGKEQVDEGKSSSVHTEEKSLSSESASEDQVQVTEVKVIFTTDWLK